MFMVTMRSTEHHLLVLQPVATGQSHQMKAYVVTTNKACVGVIAYLLLVIIFHDPKLGALALPAPVARG